MGTGPAWVDSAEQPLSSSPLAASLLLAPTQVKTSFWDTGGHHIICNTVKRYWGDVWRGRPGRRGAASRGDGHAGGWGALGDCACAYVCVCPHGWMCISVHVSRAVLNDCRSETPVSRNRPQMPSCCLVSGPPPGVRRVRPRSASLIRMRPRSSGRGPLLPVGL